MKKVFFSIAFAAIAAACVSCGNKSAQKAESQDSVTVAEVQPVETVAAAVAKTIDKAAYTIGMPEGWTAMSEGDTECLIYKGENLKVSEIMDATWVAMKVGETDEKPLDDAIKEMVKEMGAKQLDDVTVDGTTYKQLSFTEDGVESRILILGGEKPVSFTITRATADDADVQAILKSFKLK